MLSMLIGCQQEAGPQVAGGYGLSHVYVDDQGQLWIDVRTMQDGGNVISVDDAGGNLSFDVGGVVPQLDDTDKLAVSLYGSGSGSGDAVVEISSCGGLKTIDHLDAAIHVGCGYEASGRVNLGNGATYDVLVTVHAVTECAMVFEVDAEAEASYILYENPTLYGGTAITAFNRDRNSANTADTVISHTPTVTTTGTVIRTRHWGYGKAEGALNRGGWETLLAQSEEYLLRITNETTSVNYICWILRWHED